MTDMVLTFPSADLMRVVRAADELDTERVAASVGIGGGAGDVGGSAREGEQFSEMARGRE